MIPHFEDGFQSRLYKGDGDRYKGRSLNRAV